LGCEIKAAGYRFIMKNANRYLFLIFTFAIFSCGNIPSPGSVSGKEAVTIIQGTEESVITNVSLATHESYVNKDLNSCLNAGTSSEPSSLADIDLIPVKERFNIDEAVSYTRKSVNDCNEAIKSLGIIQVSIGIEAIETCDFKTLSTLSTDMTLLRVSVCKLEKKSLL
jgi:small lipoprotein (TIGR04452 family)